MRKKTGSTKYLLAISATAFFLNSCNSLFQAKKDNQSSQADQSFFSRLIPNRTNGHEHSIVDTSNYNYQAQDSGAQDQAFQRAVSAANRRSPASKSEAFPSSGWSESYNTFLEQRIPDKFIDSPPPDITKLCPQYHSLQENQKREAWAKIFESIAYAETHHQRNTQYPEPGKMMRADAVTGKRVVSEGFMQVSYQDSKVHGCHFDYRSDRGKALANRSITDPYKNLDCGIRIMEKQLQKRKKIVTNSGGSFYWSTLNPNVKGSSKHYGFGILSCKMSQYRACGLSTNMLSNLWNRTWGCRF